MSRWLLAVMAVSLFIALVVAVTGFEALFSGVDPIREPDATPYLGPSMVTSVAAVVFFTTAGGARRGNPIVSGLVAAALGYLVMLLVGSFGYTMITGNVADLVVFPAGYALGPFVIGTVIIGFAVVVGAVAVSRHADRSHRNGAPPQGARGSDPHGLG
ncbi:DUF6121 family protein [Curtobacterium ammoniigenes]|uniref:DUF6121 family protein n=1 Tax=Curtobacterium ammoniigenes TaxID=395387 RepID=UPI0008347097|nr:DUF6121 family protein [Curtobacterium ammoniigenes]